MSEKSSRIIQFRVTNSQYLRIQNKKESLGYLRLSDFLRDILLKDDMQTLRLLREIHNKVVLGDGDA